MNPPPPPPHEFTGGMDLEPAAFLANPSVPNTPQRPTTGDVGSQAQTPSVGNGTGAETPSSPTLQARLNSIQQTIQAQLHQSPQQQQQTPAKSTTAPPGTLLPPPNASAAAQASPGALRNFFALISPEMKRMRGVDGEETDGGSAPGNGEGTLECKETLGPIPLLFDQEAMNLPPLPMAQLPPMQQSLPLMPPAHISMPVGGLPALPTSAAAVHETTVKREAAPLTPRTSVNAANAAAAAVAAAAAAANAANAANANKPMASLLSAVKPGPQVPAGSMAFTFGDLNSPLTMSRFPGQLAATIAAAAAANASAGAHQAQPSMGGLSDLPLPRSVVPHPPMRPTAASDPMASPRFTCAECGKCFPSNSALAMHLLVHSGEKPFACPQKSCAKRFRQKGHLVSHYRKHTGEKPFLCPSPSCGKRFKDKSGLNTHVKRQHPGVSAAHVTATVADPEESADPALENAIAEANLTLQALQNTSMANLLGNAARNSGVPAAAVAAAAAAAAAAATAAAKQGDKKRTHAVMNATAAAAHAHAAATAAVQAAGHVAAVATHAASAAMPGAGLGVAPALAEPPNGAFVPVPQHVEQQGGLHDAQQSNPGDPAAKKARSDSPALALPSSASPSTAASPVSFTHSRVLPTGATTQSAVHTPSSFASSVFNPAWQSSQPSSSSSASAAYMPSVVPILPSMPPMPSVPLATVPAVPTTGTMTYTFAASPGSSNTSGAGTTPVGPMQTAFSMKPTPTLAAAAAAL